jgi:hypothetical protein
MGTTPNITATIREYIQKNKGDMVVAATQSIDGYVWSLQPVSMHPAISYVRKTPSRHIMAVYFLPSIMHSIRLWMLSSIRFLKEVMPLKDRLINLSNFTQKFLQKNSTF